MSRQRIMSAMRDAETDVSSLIFHSAYKRVLSEPRGRCGGYCIRDGTSGDPDCRGIFPKRDTGIDSYRERAAVRPCWEMACTFPSLSRFLRVKPGTCDARRAANPGIVQWP